MMLSPELIKEALKRCMLQHNRINCATCILRRRKDCIEMLCRESLNYIIRLEAMNKSRSKEIERLQQRIDELEESKIFREANDY